MSALVIVFLGITASAWPVLAAGQTSAMGNIANGAEVFRACAGCHSLEQGRNMSGPTLAGVIGRKAGSVSSFLRYSAALKGSGIVWTAQTIDAWLANPAAFIPGSTMPFRGLPDPKARADVIAFLAGASNNNPTAVAQMNRVPQLPRLTEAPPGQRVTALRHCRDSYFVSTADGQIRPFWEFDLRFKTDTSDRGPNKKQPVLVGQGMGGDRAQIVFAEPGEISAFISNRCE
ncbi:MAG TPA: cytochrome c family protein [Casimicrobiaceae bacterium]|jgi:cytochrome c